jgi:hypothetical protein
MVAGHRPVQACGGARSGISAEVERQTIVNVRGRNGGVPCSHRNLMQVRYDSPMEYNPTYPTAVCRPAVRRNDEIADNAVVTVGSRREPVPPEAR